jgi:DNA-binding transcriptional regulator YiaG
MVPGRGPDGRPTLPIKKRINMWPIGEQMREARFDAEMTQTSVAHRLCVSVRTLREWESGRRKPNAEQLDAYLRVVGGSITLGVVRQPS